MAPQRHVQVSARWEGGGDTSNPTKLVGAWRRAGVALAAVRAVYRMLDLGLVPGIPSVDVIPVWELQLYGVG